MNTPNEDALWQRISKSLFQGPNTTDQALFTYRVMEKIRALNPALEEAAWHGFLRWAVPLLGVGAASLILATRAPAPRALTLMDSALFQSASNYDDPLMNALEDSR